MSKTKLIIAILLLSLVLSLFAGCKAQNGNVSNNEGTEPSGNVTEPSEDVTEPSGEATEPSEDVTDPTETFCPRTVEAIKPHITPYITYGEVRALLGKKNAEYSSGTTSQAAKWQLENGYTLSMYFQTTTGQELAQYLNELRAQLGELTEDEFGFYFNKWYDQMPAYKAVICKGELDGLGEVVEVLFDHMEDIEVVVN